MSSMPWTLRWGLMMAVLLGKLEAISFQSGRGYAFQFRLDTTTDDVPKRWISRRADRREFRSKIVADLAVDRDQVVRELERVLSSAGVAEAMKVLDRSNVTWKQVDDAMA